MATFYRMERTIWYATSDLTHSTANNISCDEGTIFSLNLAGQPVVVLNDFTSAGDLVGQ